MCYLNEPISKLKAAVSQLKMMDSEIHERTYWDYYLNPDGLHEQRRTRNLLATYYPSIGSDTVKGE